MELDIEFILFILLLLTGVIMLARYFMPTFFAKSKLFKELMSFFPIVLFVFSFRAFAYEPFRIPSGSMKPVFVEGDAIVIDKYSHGIRLPILGKRLTHAKPKRGDVVVFRGEVKGKPAHVIKRIIGLPGDHIQYKNKQLSVNGKLLEKEFKSFEYDEDLDGSQYPVSRYKEVLDNKEYDIYNSSLSSHNSYPYQDVIVPKNQYFVMGNNRDNSHDSRYWGFLSDDKIVGRARLIWFSMKLDTFQIRWDRMGTVI